MEKIQETQQKIIRNLSFISKYLTKREPSFPMNFPSFLLFQFHYLSFFNEYELYERMMKIDTQKAHYC